MATRKERLKELYNKVDNVKPYAEKDGEVYVSFEDAAILNSYNADEPRTGLQRYNTDGSLATTGKLVHALNPEYYFSNRYKVKNKKMYLVSGHTTDGYRCIKEQKSGHTFIKSIPVYVLARGADVKDDKGNVTKGELYVEKMTTVTEMEFVAEYTEMLKPKDMAEILPLLTSYGTDKTATGMPI